MESLFDLKKIFTRQDEYNQEITDIHKRSTSALSPLKIDNPVVSEYLLERNKLNVLYPGNKKFAVCLTHDIDKLFIEKKIIIKEIIKCLCKFSFIRLSPLLSTLSNKKNGPYYNINKILEIEKQYNAKSTFFFLALDKDEKDFNYNIDGVVDVFKKIKEYDSEIGLHAGHLAYNDLKKLSQEKQKLENTINSKVIGIRNHFLKFKNPETWEIQSKAGFKYDASYGYNDVSGFRNGLCHPFTPYNSAKNEYIDILAIPLIIMDCTLDRYMQLDSENSWKYVKDFIDKTESVGGVFNLLWHNTYFTENNLNLYIKILEYCSSKGAWLTSGEKIYKWWNDNNIKTKFYEDIC